MSQASTENAVRYSRTQIVLHWLTALMVLAMLGGGLAYSFDLVGSEVLILDEERGRGLLGLGTELGTRWPAHATATGKAREIGESSRGASVRVTSHGCR